MDLIRRTTARAWSAIPPVLPRLALLFAAFSCPTGSSAQTVEGYTPEECSSCEAWNRAHAAVRIFGNSYWVGTEGLGAILITSEEGHILIDGGLPESAPLIERNIRDLGFRIEDVQLILNSHAHYDHAGGLAGLQKVSGAEVAALAPAAATLERGESAPGDPQHGVLLPFPPVSSVRQIDDGDSLRVGGQVVVAHHTGGHTPGGTTWSWISCEDGRCLHLVYADSQTPISADGFLFSSSADYASAIDDFRRGSETLDALRCDILITPHPGASGFWERLSARETGARDALVDPDACRRYAETAREQLERRLERERSGMP